MKEKNMTQLWEQINLREKETGETKNLYNYNKVVKNIHTHIIIINNNEYIFQLNKKVVRLDLQKLLITFKNKRHTRYKNNGKKVKHWKI